MVKIYDKFNGIIGESKNLRGLRLKVSKEIVDVVGIFRNNDGSGELKVDFKNGDNCSVNFASFQVLKMFVKNWRNVYGAQLIVDCVECGDVYNKNRALLSIE